MLSKAWDCIKLNRMIEKEDRIVVGVSGGADSVCLLYILKQFCKECGAYLCVVHVNHGIRGEEATRDEQYVKELCYRWEIEFLSFSYAVKEIAERLKLSEEEAGRKVRYEAFSEVCETRGCNKIAIAHNKNDNAETVLFHLFRGTGLKGLSGIAPMRTINTNTGHITLIRPLISCTRAEIEEYLQSKDILWQTDSTNLTEVYTRNKIRNRILKYAEQEINSGAASNIAEACAQVREAADYIEAGINKSFQEIVEENEAFYTIAVRSMQAEHPVIQKGIIFKILEQLAGRRKDLEATHIEAVLSLMDKQVGRIVHLPYAVVAERDYDHIRLFIGDGPDQENTGTLPMAPVSVAIPGKTFVPQHYKFFETEIVNYKNNISIPKNSCVKWFDYDKIENAVEIRTRREGDYIQINSNGGNKKLKDYFIDHKVPRRMRDSQLLVTDGKHVMWIVGEGERISEKYKVDDTTSRVLVMKMFDLEEDADDKES